MSPRPKRLPRLWCAMQGLLPFEACEAAQRGELAWPNPPEAPAGNLSVARSRQKKLGSEPESPVRDR